MILTKYLTKATIKTQFAILLALMLVFFSQKLVKILADAIDGNIPTNLIGPFLMFGLSDIVQLILPLSLFLAILITFTRLYLESEIIAMLACGIKRTTLYKAVLILSIVTVLLAIANSLWLGPLSNIQKARLIENIKINPSLAGLLEGQFQKLPKGDSVLYIGSVNKSEISNIFIAQLNPTHNKKPSIIIANKGVVIDNKDNNQIIQLDRAKRYEGTAPYLDFRITEFSGYQAIIKPKSIALNESKTNENVEQLSFWKLRKINTNDAKAEYGWRLVLIFSAPLMAFLVIPLSEVNPRQGKLANFLPAILLYLIYFLLQSSIKANGARGRLDPHLWFWIINIFYLGITLLLHFWNSVRMRKLRFYILRG